VVIRLRGDLPYALGRRHQRIPHTEHREGGDPESEQALQGRVLGQRPEKLPSAPDPEPDVVGHRDPQQASRLPDAVPSQLSDCAGQRPILQATGRADQNRPIESLGIQMSELADDGTAHGIPDQRCRPDVPIVQECRCRMRKIRYVQTVIGSTASAESRQVGDKGAELLSKKLRGGQQVAAREPESVHMHHDRSGNGHS
jgi:hypothetical protein